MARAETLTQLSLDRWAQIIGVNPLHFNQVYVPGIMPVKTCDNIWKQHPWQETDQIGREDVAQAIQQAEDIMARQMGHRPLPIWEVDERKLTARPGAIDLFNIGAQDPRGFWLGVKASWGHFISGGIEAKTLIEAGTAILYTDTSVPLDGYAETATITVSDTDALGHQITDEEEVAVYFPGENGADMWEVKPLRSVVIDNLAGTIDITMWRHQLVDPELWEALVPAGLDGTVAGNFLLTLDVYRHWTDPQQQVQLIWSNRGCGCGLSTCVACTFQTQWGCLTAKDHRQGLINYRPASWDSTDKEFDGADLSVCRNPDRLRLWYRAGHRDQRKTWPSLQMDSQLERAIAYFSVTFLDREVCGCSNVEQVVKKWREELNLNIADRTYQLSDGVLNNPFGQTKGAVFAWREVNRQGRSIGQAVRY